MKRFLFLLTFACVAMFAACEYDDSALWGEIDGVKQELADHERRIAALEELCKQMNTNISALQTAVTALQNNDFVTNVAPITKDGETIGYTVTFSKSGSITIYNGEDGEDGADGEDAVAPVIGVKQDSDGVYYWTLDGEWLTDESGNKIKAEGKDGKDGEDATDGEDGVTPQLKIENDYWYVSYDNGATWKRLGKATGDSSTNVTDCDCIIKDVRQDDDNVYFELTDGTIITIPKSNGDNNSGDDDDGDTSATLPPSNEIWYTSTDGKIVAPYDSNVFGANIVSNTYENGKGVIKFDGDVTEIGKKAFFEVTSLSSINLPESVVSIGNSTFSYCTSLTTVSLSKNLQIIDRLAFSSCANITDLIIPDKVETIKYGAFFQCYSLTEITIPKSVETIEERVFGDCPSLNAFYGKFATFDNKALIVDNVLIAYAVGNKTREYNIPNNVITIGESAFCAGYNLTEITIPESVKEINYAAFYKCLALPKISIPKNVAKIGEYAFALCEKLTNITIPNSVTEIGGRAFSGCSYLCQVFCKAITPPVAIESKDHPGTWSAFVGNAQGRRIYVPAESIEAYRMADWWNNYASAIVADNLDRISNNEIWYTSIDGNSITPYATAAFGVNIVSNTYENGNGIITFDGDVAKIGNNAFYNCSSLTSVTIPNSVTVIGDSAFSECSSLTNITIPDSVTKIGDYALYQCTSLTNITIPNNITAIGKGAFFDCRSLTSVYCKPITPPSVGLYIFHDALTGLKIFVPIGSGDAYKAADGWKRYAYAIQEKAM